MATEEPVANAPLRIFIQINGEKTSRVESVLSTTIADFRAILRSQKVLLPQNAQFLDALGYPVPVTGEKSINISDLVVKTDDGETIKLKVKEYTTNADTQRYTIMTTKNLIFIITILSIAYYVSNEERRSAIIHQQLCPLFIKMNFTSVVDKLTCSMDQNTSDYLLGQIADVTNGAKGFADIGKGVNEVTLTGDNQDYVEMYKDWVQNKTQYHTDYNWYSNMTANWGHCPGHFDEKVLHSNNLILDTPESIQQFVKDEFQNWPQNLTAKLNIANRLESAANNDGDGFDLDINGKISTNMYLVAWKREGNNTIRIHTYVTIFERTAGHGCVFNPEYWSGHRDRINNAKKYFLLTKVESNPVYKTFLLGRRRT